MTGKTQRRLAVGALVLALAGGGATYAAAAGGNGGGGPPGGPGFAQAAATYLGLTAAELRTQLDSGKSLAQIATSEGKSVSGLETAIYAAAKVDLDKDVASGRITSAQEQTILSDLKSHLDDVVNRTGPPAGGPGHGGPRFADAAAAYLGLTNAQLRTQIESGKSLAQIATAQGKSVSGLEDAIYAAAKTQLDKDVASGRITSAQEQTILADLKAHIDDIVNRTGPPGPLRA